MPVPFINPVSSLWFLVTMEKYKAIRNIPWRLYGNMDSCVQLLRNKSSRKWYEKHQAINYTRTIFCLIFPKKKRIRIKVIIVIIIDWDEKEYKSKDVKKSLHRRGREVLKKRKRNKGGKTREGEGRDGLKSCYHWEVDTRKTLKQMHEDSAGWRKVSQCVLNVKVSE